MRRFFYNANLNPNLDIETQSKVLNSDQSIHNLQKFALGTLLELPDAIYHHWCRVLRAKIGEQSLIFDGLGGESIIKLESTDKKKAIARILAHNNIDNTPDYNSTVAIVMSRGDRMDYAIQKSTELGATAIQLLTSQHGEVRLKASQVNKKLNHWQQVALSASEQCGLNRPTLVLSPLSIEHWLMGKMGQPDDNIQYLLNDPFYNSYFKQHPLRLVLAVPRQDEKSTLEVDSSIRHHLLERCTDNSSLKSLGSLPLPRVDILIGAEGGLSNEEYNLARKGNYLPWQLGNRVLRTETAPVVALSTLLYISENI